MRCSLFLCGVFPLPNSDGGSGGLSRGRKKRRGAGGGGGQKRKEGRKEGGMGGWRDVEEREEDFFSGRVLTPGNMTRSDTDGNFSRKLSPDVDLPKKLF